MTVERCNKRRGTSASGSTERNFGHLLILGTKYLMEGPVYPTRLRSRAIEWEMPPPDERQHINALIFDELVYGRFEESPRSYFKQGIARSKERGTDAAVLACTESALFT